VGTSVELEIGAKVETVRDRDDLIAVYLDAYADRLGDPFLAPERHWDRVQGYASAGGYGIVEARVDGQMIGYALGYTLPENARWWQGLTIPVEPPLLVEDGSRTFALTYMMVRVEFRRRGYAKKMHDALLSSRSEKRATLLVHPANVAARSAYYSWGWYKIGDLQPFSDAPIYEALLKDL
jgi:ribosomal protein S18 acetylase RimI-like enzyme